MNRNSQNFSPDGMRGGSMERRHETGHSRDTRGGHRSEQADTEHNHEFYDDGLVHSHGWAASTNER